VIKNFGQEWIPNPNESLKAVLHEGAKRIGWEDRHPPGRGPFFDGCKKRGIGFSFHQVWHSEWEEEGRGDVQVGIKLNPDLSVILDAPTVETGGGSNNVALMACAESLNILGITLDDIRYVERIDTESGLKDTVQTDSAVALLLSEAVDDAAKKVIEQVLELGAKKFQVSTEDLVIEDGRIFPTVDPEQGVTIKDLLWVHSGYVPVVPIVVTVSRKPDLELTGVPYQATFAEVEVDIETGVVKVLRMVIVNDAGTVLYPTGAEAQQIGGQVMALGETLTEELVYDPRTGTALNFNLTDYTIFTMLDMPPVEPVLMEVWRGAGKYGASGIGEGTLVNTPGAVLNAIYNAVGVRVDHIPVSPADILRELNDRGSHEDI